MDRFAAAVDHDLDTTAAGGGAFKAVRGDLRVRQDILRALASGTSAQRRFCGGRSPDFRNGDAAVHKWEAVYRRLIERLATSDTPVGALRPIIDTWFFTLEEEVLAEGRVDAADGIALSAATEALMERRLAEIARTAPAFSAILRTYRRALLAEDGSLAEGFVAWLGGQPNVGAAVKRAAGLKGDLDAFGAMHFLAGFLKSCAIGAGRFGPGS